MNLKNVATRSFVYLALMSAASVFADDKAADDLVGAKRPNFIFIITDDHGWPESLGYSRHVGSFVIYLMTALDRIYPELQLGKRYRNITQGLTAYYNLQSVR